jgi:hypothetical protein
MIVARREEYERYKNTSQPQLLQIEGDFSGLRGK